ncbi:MAG TPA: alpha-ketoacid dehydrogenase subunit beta [Elusimicrobia bacterium]|nr:alpha-ketoacid dehydrogenase subunit beta [Elusimicrobiota bacterium]HBT61591.1 alpha-ketoacid dehydrogenase subunit beta [Elusimicrobiota bacterium]
MAKLNIVSAINMALDQEMERDGRVMILGEDVGREGGVFRVTDGLQKKYGSQRVVDTPLAEAGIIGTALGLALGGMRPVAEIQFEGFIHLALDQICNQLARYRTRSRGRCGLGVVVRVPWGGGIHAPELHSDSPETLLVHTPGLTVLTPSTPYDAKGLMLSALRLGDPVIFCEPKRIYRAIKGEVPEADYTVPIGQARVSREGRDLTIVAWGAMMREALEAADELQAQGASAEVIDLRTLSPMDSDTVIASVRKTGRLVIAHEAPRTLGLGAELAARVGEEALTSLLAPIERVTGYDTVMPLAQLEEFYLPDHSRIVAGAKKALNS